MRICSIILIISAAAIGISCGPSRPATPLETFKTYVKAIKAKDTTTMKVLLSKATVQMHEREAKAQGVTVDDIVKRETLFSETQTTVEFRNEKIDGDRATLEVKNSYGSWETVPFVREDGEWKIDKQGYAEQMLRDIDDQQDQVFDGLRSVEPLGTPQLDPSVTPQSDPEATPQQEN